MKVFAFSLITNECIIEYETDAQANHEEVRSAACDWAARGARNKTNG